MKSLLKSYNEFNREKYSALSFVSIKDTFARVSNDVLHTFSLKILNSSNVCTIDFGIIPLCMYIPEIGMGGYSLECFSVDRYIVGGWKYDPKADESMTSCVRLLSQAIDAHIIPLFNICTDCQSTLPELIKLEELFDDNRKQALSFIGGRDHAKSLRERSLFDPRKYYMALKSHNYAYAHEYLQHQVNFHRAELENLQDTKAPKQPDVVIKGLSNNLHMYSEQLQQLQLDNVAYFDEMIQLGEKQTRDLLVARYPGMMGL